MILILTTFFFSILNHMAKHARFFEKLINVIDFVIELVSKALSFWLRDEWLINKIDSIDDDNLLNLYLVH